MRLFFLFDVRKHQPGADRKWRMDDHVYTNWPRSGGYNIDRELQPERQQSEWNSNGSEQSGFVVLSGHFVAGNFHDQRTSHRAESVELEPDAERGLHVRLQQRHDQQHRFAGLFGDDG